jgi:hypothetical protein
VFCGAAEAVFGERSLTGTGAVDGRRDLGILGPTEERCRGAALIE